MEHESDRDGDHNDQFIRGFHHGECKESPGRTQYRARQVDRFPANRIGEFPDERNNTELDRMRDEHQQQDLGRVHLDDHHQVRDRERNDEVIQHVFRKS